MIRKIKTVTKLEKICVFYANKKKLLLKKLTAKSALNLKNGKMFLKICQ